MKEFRLDASQKCDQTMHSSLACRILPADSMKWPRQTPALRQRWSLPSNQSENSKPAMRHNSVSSRVKRPVRGYAARCLLLLIIFVVAGANRAAAADSDDDIAVVQQLSYREGSK